MNEPPATSASRAAGDVDHAAGLYALSPLQQGMLFHWLLDPGAGTDVEQIVGDLHEPIDVARLEAAWQGTVDHFSTLRTEFAWDGLAAPMQQVREQARLPFEFRDIRHEAEGTRDQGTQEFLNVDRRTGIDLARAPLMRVTMLQLADAHFRMIWTFHHILIDGRAFEIILNDVFARYEGVAGIERPDRPYREYIDWVARQDPVASVAFWRDRLAGFTAPTPLPSSHAVGGVSSGFGQIDVGLSIDVTNRLRNLATRESLSLNVLVMGAWALLLSRHSGTTDIVLGASKTTRRGTIPDADAMVGMFLATIPVRVDVDASLPVAEWLRRIRADWVAARGHEHLPLIDIRHASALGPSVPLFESLVVFENYQLGTRLRAQGGAWSLRHFITYEQTGFPLTLLAYGDEALALRLEYDRRRMDAQTANAWIRELRDILDGWAGDATQPLIAASTGVGASTAPDSPRDVSSSCIHELIEAQVEQTPDATAVVFGEAQLTYRELNERANVVARQLRNRGVGPDVLVGICVDRSIEMVVGLLGILKAGGAYVPLDPAYPADRLTVMLEDAHVPAVVTQRHLVHRLGASAAVALFVDDVLLDPGTHLSNVDSGATPANLAYVIFTSGSTGRPKGTMIEHRNVTNFFAGMDEVLGSGPPGVWLAVTSISFDISVLELFWTLARGFEVVIAPSLDRAALEGAARAPVAGTASMQFGLFYFAAHSDAVATGDAYRLLLEGAKFADTHDFTAVWTPERHFHAFGGLYPNPAVTTAALATITSRVQLRAGSIVLPLHNPMRVAEDWAVIDQLSGGRVGLSFASGWHVNDFAFMPENFERRREVMNESIDTVLRLWRGERMSVRNGAGKMIDVAVLPRPIQARPPIWIASAGSVDTFVLAGRLGANVLTNMLGQDLADLTVKFAAYRAARREHGHDGDGIITVMLHTFVTDDTEEARRLARKPFSDYLASSYDLVKIAPTMFPAFRQPSRTAAGATDGEPSVFSDEDMAALLDHAFDRYFDTAGLFGTPERALTMIESLARIGANEVACLIDFGVDSARVLESLPHLDRLRRMCTGHTAAADSSVGRGMAITETIRRRGVTHLQCTPSIARALADDPAALAAMAGLETLLIGGEAFPVDLADRLASVVRGRILNMYGPTETTIWSTTAPVRRGVAPNIGRPIINTTVHVLDEHLQPVPSGTPGELFIGGLGVVRGYLDRPDLTAARFVPDPFAGHGRLYRTGDLVRQRPDGALDYLGRVDDQVKLNGYRIELGEIEATLSAHAAVRQGVVVARSAGSDNTAQRLVAYVVPASNGMGHDADTDRVGAWRQLWNEAYENGAGEDARFRIAGWNDSYTGQPIPASEMREWVDTTAERILSLAPRRVLEIGCGTGLLLYRVLPHVEHYTGVDISPAALDGIRRELTPVETGKVTLVETSAEALSQVAPQSVDLVIINSVAQYFPSADYLARVLKTAATLVDDGGRIFVGDVRSLEHLESFHTALELRQATGDSDIAGLGARITRRMEQEGELLVSPRFFESLVAQEPRIANVSVELKRGASRNEMTMFRYDVVLDVNTSARAAARSVTTIAGVNDLSFVEDQLAAAPEAILFRDIPNARLSAIVSAMDAIRLGAPATVDILRAQLDTSECGVDPESLYARDGGYAAHIRWSQSGNPGTFDALMVRKDRADIARWPEESTLGSSDTLPLANTPATRSAEATLLSQLRAHLRRTLPEYMIPSAFVVMDTLPLTPNGKIDRKALPVPHVPARQHAHYFAPVGDLEAQIADIWRDLLAIDQVGRADNIFELGANSLLTMQANSRLSRVLGRTLPLVSMFRYPTVASLAAHLANPDGQDSAQASGKREQARASRAEQNAERRRALRAERGES